MVCDYIAFANIVILYSFRNTNETNVISTLYMNIELRKHYIKNPFSCGEFEK